MKAPILTCPMCHADLPKGHPLVSSQLEKKRCVACKKVKNNYCFCVFKEPKIKK